jgi:hypothetical protein
MLTEALVDTLKCDSREKYLRLVKGKAAGTFTLPSEIVQSLYQEYSFGDESGLVQVFDEEVETSSTHDSDGLHASNEEDLLSSDHPPRVPLTSSSDARNQVTVPLVKEVERMTASRNRFRVFMKVPEAPMLPGTKTAICDPASVATSHLASETSRHTPARNAQGVEADLQSGILESTYVYVDARAHDLMESDDEDENYLPPLFSSESPDSALSTSRSISPESPVADAAKEITDVTLQNENQYTQAATGLMTPMREDQLLGMSMQVPDNPENPEQDALNMEVDLPCQPDDQRSDAAQNTVASVQQDHSSGSNMQDPGNSVIDLTRPSENRQSPAVVSSMTIAHMSRQIGDAWEHAATLEERLNKRETECRRLADVIEDRDEEIRSLKLEISAVTQDRDEEIGSLKLELQNAAATNADSMERAKQEETRILELYTDLQESYDAQNALLKAQDKRIARITQSEKTGRQQLQSLERKLSEMPVDSSKKRPFSSEEEDIYGATPEPRRIRGLFQRTPSSAQGNSPGG